MQPLERRVAALEASLARERRRSRTLRTLGLLTLASLTLGAAAQKGVPLVLRTKSLEIVDDAGTTVVRASGTEGRGALEIFDGQGLLVAELRGGRDGGLKLRDPSGRVLYQLGATPAGAVAHFLAPDGTPLMRLGSSELGGVVALAAREGRSRLDLQATPQGSRAELTDVRGVARAMVSTMDDQGRLVVHTQHGSPAAVLESIGDTSRMRLVTTNGTDVWNAVTATAEPRGGTFDLAASPTAAGLALNAVTTGSQVLVAWPDGARAFEVGARGFEASLALTDRRGAALFGAGNPGAGPTAPEARRPAGAGRGGPGKAGAKPGGNQGPKQGARQGAQAGGRKKGGGEKPGADTAGTAREASAPAPAAQDAAAGAKPPAAGGRKPGAGGKKPGPGGRKAGTPPGKGGKPGGRKGGAKKGRAPGGS